MQIRPLCPADDAARVGALFDVAADYILLESGAAPDPSTTQDFFDDRPPGQGPFDAAHFGLFDASDLLGVMAMSFGYPDAGDAYIGLLVLAPAARGQGKGAQAVDFATHNARMRGASRLLVAVLDCNPKARAFWEREGFTLERTFPPTADTHVRHRLARRL